MSTVTFSQEAAPLEPHQQADDEANSDGRPGSCVGSKKRKIVVPVLAGAAISLAVSGVGYLLLAPGQRWMSGPDVGRKAEQVENRLPAHDHTPSGVVMATPRLTPHRGPLRLASPGVESAFAAGQGRAAVARLVRNLEECGRQSPARRLALSATAKFVCLGAWTLAWTVVGVVARQFFHVPTIPGIFCGTAISLGSLGVLGLLILSLWHLKPMFEAHQKQKEEFKQYMAAACVRPAVPEIAVEIAAKEKSAAQGDPNQGGGFNRHDTPALDSTG
eukprot:GHVT01022411.1.p1 GENE.GHVT01022411.1~~GHVT01022411.1.p1  ORF type:complete len:274 (-),score=47.00 GHVT01022411.1:986-1807(-)